MGNELSKFVQEAAEMGLSIGLKMIDAIKFVGKSVYDGASWAVQKAIDGSWILVKTTAEGIKIVVQKIAEGCQWVAKKISECGAYVMSSVQQGMVWLGRKTINGIEWLGYDSKEIFSWLIQLSKDLLKTALTQKNLLLALAIAFLDKYVGNNKSGHYPPFIQIIMKIIASLLNAAVESAKADQKGQNIDDLLKDPEGAAEEVKEADLCNTSICENLLLFIKAAQKVYTSSLTQIYENPIKST